MFKMFGCGKTNWTYVWMMTSTKQGSVLACESNLTTTRQRQFQVLTQIDRFFRLNLVKTCFRLKIDVTVVVTAVCIFINRAEIRLRHFQECYVPWTNL